MQPTLRVGYIQGAYLPLSTRKVTKLTVENGEITKLTL